MDAEDVKLLERYVRDKIKAEAKGKLAEVAQLCNCVGEMYSKYGRFEEAISEHNKEKQLCEALEDRIGEAVACRMMGECYCALDQYSQALELQKRHLTLARDCQNCLEEQRAWATIGRTYLCKAESRNLMESSLANTQAEKSFFKALDTCEKVKTIVKPAEYMAMKCRVLLNIGLVYDNRADTKQSTDVIKRAVLVAEKHHLDEELLMCRASLASVYQNSRNYLQAIQSYELAIKLAQNLRNKIRECDLLTNTALLHVAVGNFLEGKHCLKKAHKLKVGNDDVTRKITSMFKAVNRIQEAKQELESTEDLGRTCELHEVVADCLAEMGLYRDAIDHYLKVLTSDHLSQEKKAAIYVSLAQTYSDTRQYESAIFYYKKEIEVQRDNPEQTCRTKLNIAELEELNGKKYTAVCKLYMEAFDLAKKAKHIKLMIRTLKSLIEVQKLCEQWKHMEETEKTLESVRKKYKMTDEEDEEEKSEQDNDSPKEDEKESDLSVSDLTVSEESDEDDDQPTVVTTSYRKKSNVARRNEKGETPLHRACIDGNLKKVKSLIAEGHPINPRDHCGWIPLHEAANYNHAAIVECLLEKGAWINDRGGEHCGGVTPLMDAANCGSLEVMGILMRHGANLMAKDDDGNTALDCLQCWYSRSSDSLGASEMLTYSNVEKLLQEATGKNQKAPGKGTTTSKTSNQSFHQKDGGKKASCPSSSATSNSSSSSLVVSAVAHTSKPSTVTHTSKPTSSLSTKNRMKRLPDLEDLELQESSLSITKSSFKDRLLKLREKRVTNKSMSKSRPSRGERGDNDKNEDADKSDVDSFHEPDPFLPSLSNDHDSNMWNNAADSYRKVMQSMRSSAQSRIDDDNEEENGNENEVCLRKKIPCFQNDDDVGDDWLINDIGQAPKGKKRSYDVNKMLSSNGIRSKSTKTTKTKRARYGSGCSYTSSNSESAQAASTSSFSRKSADILDEMFGLDNDDDDNDSFNVGQDDQLTTQSLKQYSIINVDSERTTGNSDNCPDLTTIVSKSTSSADKQDMDFWDTDDDDLLYSSDLLYDSVIAMNDSTIFSNDNVNSKHIKDNLTTLHQDSQVSSSSSVDEPSQSNLSMKTANHNLVSKSINRDNLTSSYRQNSLQPKPHNPTVTKKPSVPEASSSNNSECRPETNKVKFSVKVNIEGKILLVPIYVNDDNKTMAWLAQQVAERYFSSFFVYPVLTLKTPDGIILSPTDPVGSVLNAIPELHADVRAWNKQSVAERYEKVCQTFYEEPRTDIQSLLQNIGGLNNKLDLSDLNLGLRPLLPVFQALDGERTLVELILSGNRMSDSALPSLTKLLASLPNLKVLVLDSNELSTDGLDSLASFAQSGSGLQLLSELSLSYNCLTDKAESSIKFIIKSLNSLSTLRLAACYLTSEFFTPGLLKTLGDCLLDKLTLSENQLSREVVHSVLGSLYANSRGLNSLDLAHCFSSNGLDPNFGLETVFQPITACHGGRLQCLSLAGCHLSKEDVLVVNRLPLIIPTLRQLNISLNRNFDNTCLQKLLSISASKDSNLQSITARGCGNRSPLGDEIIDSLKFKLRSNVPLIKLVFSCRGLTSAESDLVSQLWMEKWDGAGKVKASGMILDLSVPSLSEEGF